MSDRKRHPHLAWQCASVHSPGNLMVETHLPGHLLIETVGHSELVLNRKAVETLRDACNEALQREDLPEAD